MPQCETCFSNGNGKCKKDHTNVFGDCPYYEEKKPTEEVAVEPGEVIWLLREIRELPQEEVTLAATLPGSANPKRDQFIIFLDATFGEDTIASGSEMLYNCLMTLQPLMFRKAIRCNDPRFRGKTAYIFEYPCGQYSIQIKIYMEDHRVCAISFHEGETKVSPEWARSQERRYRYVLDKNPRLYIGNVVITPKVEMIWDSGYECYFDEWRLFLAQYQRDFLQMLQGSVSVLCYGATMRSRLRLQGTVSNMILADSLTYAGAVHALLTLLDLTTDSEIRAAVVTRLQQADASQHMEVIQHMDSVLYNSVSAKLAKLLKGGD